MVFTSPRMSNFTHTVMRVERYFIQLLYLKNYIYIFVWVCVCVFSRPQQSLLFSLVATRFGYFGLQQAIFTKDLKQVTCSSH